MDELRRHQAQLDWFQNDNIIFDQYMFNVEELNSMSSTCLISTSKTDEMEQMFDKKKSPSFIFKFDLKV